MTRIFLVFTIPILTIYRHPNIEQAIFLITLIDPFIHYPGIDRTSLTWYPLPTTNDYVINITENIIYNLHVRVTLIIIDSKG